MPGVSLTQPIQELFAKLDAYRDGSLMANEKETTLEVDSLLSGAAKFYEKVRYLIDYREEHTIRRNAVERILRRKVLIESQSVIGADLLKELVEGQYLSKDLATEERGKKISDVVARYQALSAHREVSNRVERRLLSFAATEVERLLSEESNLIDEGTAEALYATVRPSVAIQGVSEKEVDVQLFCAARRALLGIDNDALAYGLWRAYVRDWQTSELDVQKLLGDLSQIVNVIEQDIKNPLQWQLAAKIKNESIYFQVLRELIHKKKGSAEWVLSDQKSLDAFTREFLEEKYEQENKKLQSSGVRAVGYLFFTKTLAALFVELPYELFILGSIHVAPLVTNIVFHPLLLLTFTRGMRSLNSANTDAIIEGMHDVLLKGKSRSIRIKSEHSALSAVFGLVYFALICALFLGIVGILTALNFNFASMVLFVFFLALVSYFTFRIRSNAQRWKVSGKEGALSVLVHVLAVPIVRTGRYLSQTFSSINVLVLFMDFILETPFKLLLNFSSKFFVYLREKADDVY